MAGEVTAALAQKTDKENKSVFVAVGVCELVHIAGHERGDGCVVWKREREL